MQQLEMDLGVARLGPAPTRAAAATAPRAANTTIAYESDFNAFDEWCRESNQSAMPAAPKTIGAYLAYLWLRQGRKRSTVERVMYAIADAHARGGHANPTKHDLVRDLWRTILEANERGRTRKRSLVSDDVRRIVDKIVGGDAIDEAQRLRATRDRAMILMLYAGALKRDELRTLTRERLAFVDGRILVHVAAGDRALRPITILSGEDDVTDPTAALVDWLAESGIANGALFRGIDAGGTIGEDALDRRTMTRAIKARCELADIDPKSSRR